jgi:hypothetical protein
MTTEDCRQIAQGAFTSLVPLDRYRFLERLPSRQSGRTSSTARRSGEAWP